MTTISKTLVTKIKRLSDKAVMPTRANNTDSGWDLTIISVEKIVGDTVMFKTGLAIQPPDGYYFEIHLRSSCSSLPIMLANSVGVCDETYRGEFIVAIRVLHPSSGGAESRESYPSGIVRMLDARPTSLHEVANLLLAKKPKIAQLILRKRIDTTLEEVVSLDETPRGTGGFGSSDRK
jgi:dUTP pyrophosphatase